MSVTFVSFGDGPGGADSGEAVRSPLTSEMIAAGAYELANFNSDYQSFEDAAERIYQAMVAACPSSGLAERPDECTS